MPFYAKYLRVRIPFSRIPGTEGSSQGQVRISCYGGSSTNTCCNVYTINIPFKITNLPAVHVSNPTHTYSNKKNFNTIDIIQKDFLT